MICPLWQRPKEQKHESQWTDLLSPNSMLFLLQYQTPCSWWVNSGTERSVRELFGDREDVPGTIQITPGQVTSSFATKKLSREQDMAIPYGNPFLNANRGPLLSWSKGFQGCQWVSPYTLPYQSKTCTGSWWPEVGQPPWPGVCHSNWKKRLLSGLHWMPVDGRCGLVPW